jgi:hypothetical protein
MHMRLALLMCLVLTTFPLFAQNGGTLRGKVLVVDHSNHSTAAGQRAMIQNTLDCQGPT